jgi:putative transposase
MKKRYSEEQIVQILGEAAKGNVAEVCRKYSIGDSTYYKWRKRYDGMGVADVHKLRMLEEENRKLKRVVGEKELDIDALQAVLEKYGQAR